MELTQNNLQAPISQTYNEPGRAYYASLKYSF